MATCLKHLFQRAVASPPPSRTRVTASMARQGASRSVAYVFLGPWDYVVFLCLQIFSECPYQDTPSALLVVAPITSGQLPRFLQLLRAPRWHFAVNIFVCLLVTPCRAHEPGEMPSWRVQGSRAGTPLTVFSRVLLSKLPVNTAVPPNRKCG